MTDNYFFTTAQVHTTEAITTPPSQPKLWETELFQLSAMGRDSCPADALGFSSQKEAPAHFS